MKTVDDNWQRLREEDRSLEEKPPYDMRNAENLTIVHWNNNPKLRKLTWRENMVPNTAWLESGQSRGIWRENENRFYEQIQMELALGNYGHGFRLTKSSAQDSQGQDMINVKLMEIIRYDEILEMFLILDGSRVYQGQRSKIKDGDRWRFENSIALKTLI